MLNRRQFLASAVALGGVAMLPRAFAAEAGAPIVLRRHEIGRAHV